MKTKHFFVMKKDTLAHECVDLRVWIEPKRCTQTLVKFEDGEVKVMVMQLCCR